MTEEEFVDIAGVFSDYRVSAREDKKTITTYLWIITFESTIPLRQIKSLLLNFPVEPYVPNPMRSFGCQRYGNIQKPGVIVSQNAMSVSWNVIRVRV